MLPRRVLASSAELLGNELLPRWLGERDYPWLRLLIEQYRSCLGRPRRELHAELRKPLALPSPGNKRRVAVCTLEALSRDEAVAGPDPALVRRTLFTAAARRDRPRSAVVAEAASLLGTSSLSIEQSLFADLPGERLLAEPARALTPIDLAQESNFAIASGLLARASRLVIEARGNTRGLLRHAHLAGLIAAVSERALDSVRLEVSGPFALFRHTRVYGRALASFLPRLTWCDAFELRAECPLRGSRTTLLFTLKSGDPIGVARELAAYDGRLEERFRRDWLRLTASWDLVQDPEPMRVGERLISADFALVHRQDPARRVLVEIVGFWTPEYVQRRLADLEAAAAHPLVLCVDESKACSAGKLPPAARILRFRRRIDVRALLALIDGEP